MIIKLGMDTNEVVERFEAERQALALTNHPNICRVLDGGATDSAERRSPDRRGDAVPDSVRADREIGVPIAAGRPCFDMELVCGEPITKYCDDQRFSLGEWLELFIQFSQAA